MHDLSTPGDDLFPLGSDNNIPQAPQYIQCDLVGQQFLNLVRVPVSPYVEEDAFQATRSPKPQLGYIFVLDTWDDAVTGDIDNVFYFQKCIGQELVECQKIGI